MQQFTHEWFHEQFTQKFVLLMLMTPIVSDAYLSNQSAPKQTSHFCSQSVVQNSRAGD